MKKFLTMLLTVALLISLIAGCGGNNKDAGTPKATTDSTSDSSSKDSTAQSSDVKNEDKSDDNELYTFKIFANFSSPEMGEGDKVLFEMLEKANNVKVEFEVPPATNYLERLQIMLAGGDYPEVVLFPDEKDRILSDAVNNGVIIPLNEYLENAPNLKNYTYDISWESVKFKNDENIYGLPRTSIARADGYIVRKDWLDKVGISLPESGDVTKEEFVEILRAFSKEDPDGNGKDDTYGFAAFVDANGIMEPILKWPFGLHGWQKSEYMDLKYSLEHDNYKRALEFTQKLWQEGLLDPDWPVTKRETANERFKAGITGVYWEFAGHMQGFYNALVEIEPNVELTYITGIYDDNGEIKGGSYGTGFWGLYTITSSAEKPERIISARILEVRAYEE